MFADAIDAASVKKKIRSSYKYVLNAKVHSRCIINDTANNITIHHVCESVIQKQINMY